MMYLAMFQSAKRSSMPSKQLFAQRPSTADNHFSHHMLPQNCLSAYHIALLVLYEHCLCKLGSVTKNMHEIMGVTEYIVKHGCVTIKHACKHDRATRNIILQPYTSMSTSQHYQGWLVGAG